METLHSRFTFFKAGQGAFYGGQIFSPDTNQAWNLVYDCGTSPWIKGHSRSLSVEIDRFGEGYLQPVQEIDILFISHLDYDHVSGLSALLKKYKAKRIVLPYFPEDQRQFALVSYREGEDDGGANEPMAWDDYHGFIGNPYTFLSERAPGAEIFVVLPKEEGEEYLGYNDNSPSDDGITPSGTPTSAPGELIGLPASSRYRFYKNNLQFFLRKLWDFTTYAKDIPTANFDGLKGCLNKKLGRPEDAQLGVEELRQLVVDHRAAAHECYTKHLSDINSHGLVLLHGPIGFDYSHGRSFVESNIHMEKRIFLMNTNWFWGKSMFHERRIVCTLLMGDTSIKPDNNPVSFPTQFRSKCENVLVFQVPHHGSAKNWDLTEYLHLFRTDWFHPVFDVCNFGYGNKYGHPSHDVINDLSASIVLNSQFTSFSTELKVSYT